MAVIFFRTLIIFAVLLLLMRLLGKRQLGELELSELLVSVLMADVASIPLQDIGIPLMNGLLPVLMLFSLEMLVSGLALRSIRLRRLLFGRPCFLIRKGRIDQAEMARSRFSLDELLEALRAQSVTDPTEVDYAVLETDGSLNVILKPQFRPVTAEQMGIFPPAEGYPTLLINDGRILSHNLCRCGLEEKWLLQQCKSQGFSSPRDVYMFSYTPEGKTIILPKEKNR